jgi:predicted Rossmann fold nucleotide-binding protein DprA/Smf involved in DNA uptake
MGYAMIHSILLNQFSKKLHDRALRFEALNTLDTRAQKIWIRSQVPEPELKGFFNKPSIGIIGSRMPTGYGVGFIREFISVWAATLPQVLTQEILIFSGGAMGIDLEVHSECLRWGLPTWAWVVGPIENPNPRSQFRVFSSIESQPNSGLLTPNLLEPKPRGQALDRPLKSYWLERNRWLVASCDALVVAEANEKSGTWSSVLMAAELGIPVFALGGPYNSRQSSGTNLMISNGYAHPVVSVGKLVQTLVVEILASPYNNRWGKFSKDSTTLGIPKKT